MKTKKDKIIIGIIVIIISISLFNLVFTLNTHKPNIKSTQSLEITQNNIPNKQNIIEKKEPLEFCNVHETQERIDTCKNNYVIRKSIIEDEPKNCEILTDSKNIENCKDIYFFNKVKTTYKKEVIIKNSSNIIPSNINLCNEIKQ